MLRYFSALIATTALLMTAIGAICAYKYWWLMDLHDDPSLGQILRYQADKIERLAPGAIDTVLIGDSSLGNAIDARQLDADLGTHSINLALTGSFGYAGGLELLTRIAAKTPIKNVIFYYTIDAMARGNYEGYFFAGGPLVRLDIPLRDKLDVAALYLSHLFDGKAAVRFAFWDGPAIAATADLRERDYSVTDSRIRLDSPHLTDFHMPEAPDRQALVFLGALSRLCAQHSWNCLYTHGTLIGRLAITPAVIAFTRQANAAIRQTSIRLVAEETTPIPDKDRGDTIYHVNWKMRPTYTHVLATQIAPLIVP